MDASLAGAKEPALGLAVEDGDGRLVGDVLLKVKRARSIAGPADAWEGVIGYGLDPEVHGRGYAVEVAAELVVLGFRDLALRRISADAMRENVPSNRVLEKVGLRLETTERASVLGKDGRWLDRNVWAILREEWAAT
jgi:RimJ/RimL family protein N-acetyltransferase